MKDLIDAMVFSLIGLTTIAGINLGQEKILKEIQLKALVKAHKELVSMESLAKQLTSRKK